MPITVYSRVVDSYLWHFDMHVSGFWWFALMKHKHKHPIYCIISRMHWSLRDVFIIIIRNCYYVEVNGLACRLHSVAYCLWCVMTWKHNCHWNRILHHFSDLMKDQVVITFWWHWRQPAGANILIASNGYNHFCNLHTLCHIHESFRDGSHL